MLFFRKKSPCGSVPQKVTFSELTLRELIHFYRDLKNRGTPIFVMLVTFFQDFANFGRKPKWSVWSIRTTFKGWDWKLLTEKRSYGRKLKFGGVRNPRKHLHSDGETIFDGFPMVLGSRWKISENGDRGFTQNFGARLMSIVVCPGEPFLKILLFWS